MPVKAKATARGSHQLTRIRISTYISWAIRKKTLDAAHDWMVRLEDAERIEDLWPDFETWLAADPGHRDAFMHLEDSSRHLDRLSELRPRGESVDPDLLSRTAAGSERGELQRTSIRVAWMAVTAVVLMVLIASMYRWRQFNSSRSYETAVGGHEVVSLPDGSTIDLNTNTELRVRFSSASRKVELLRGEAMIHVRHDPQRPFVVSVGEIVIQDVGTKFDVRRRDDASTEVMIESGNLILFNGRRQIAALSEGDVALVSLQEVRVDRPGDEVIKRKLSWRDGILRFYGQSLGEVVAEFNRYNRTRMVIDDPRLAEIRLGGVFPATNLESFVSALQHVYGVQYTSIPSPDGGVIRLKSSSAKAPTG